MDVLHTDSELWGSKYCELINLIDLFTNKSYFLSIDIKNACDTINKKSEIPKANYEHPTEIRTTILTRETALENYSLGIHNQINNELETVFENLLERSASLLNSAANLDEYSTSNTLGIKEAYADRSNMTGMELRAKSTLKFYDFLPGHRNPGFYIKGMETVYFDTDQSELYVKAFGDLFQKDYNLLAKSWQQAGYSDSLPSIEEYTNNLLHQGQFDPIVTDEGWKVVRRAILDATIVVPIIETVSGKDIITGYELTSSERLGQGLTAAVGVFSLGLGIYGLAAKTGIGVLSTKEIVLYMAGNILIDMGVAGFTSASGQLLEEVLPPEVARLVAAGMGFAMAWKLNKWYDGQWDEYLAAKSSYLEHPVLNGDRVGSGTKVDTVKPITIRDPETGREIIISEFPNTPMSHGFPDIFDNASIYSTEFDLVGGDDVVRKLYQLEANYNSVDGIFEWIVDANGDITHRRFIAGGKITGKPNQIVK